MGVVIAFRPRQERRKSEQEDAGIRSLFRDGMRSVIACGQCVAEYASRHDIEILREELDGFIGICDLMASRCPDSEARGALFEIEERAWELLIVLPEGDFASMIGEAAFCVALASFSTTAQKLFFHDAFLGPAS